MHATADATIVKEIRPGLKIRMERGPAPTSGEWKDAVRVSSLEALRTLDQAVERAVFVVAWESEQTHILLARHEGLGCWTNVRASVHSFASLGRDVIVLGATAEVGAYAELNGRLVIGEDVEIGEGYRATIDGFLHGEVLPLTRSGPDNSSVLRLLRFDSNADANSASTMGVATGETTAEVGIRQC